MKITLLIPLFVATLTLGPMLRADDATNAKRLSELQALSFSTVQKVSFATLSAPAKREVAMFHGCALRSEWKEIPGVSSERLAGVLRQLIVDGIACCSRAGDAEIVWLQPFGFVCGELAIRLETDRGRREFSVTLGEKTSYVYAYDLKRHSVGFVVEGALQGELNQSRLNPNRSVSALPETGHVLNPSTGSGLAAQPGKNGDR